MKDAPTFTQVPSVPAYNLGHVWVEYASMANLADLQVRTTAGDYRLGQAVYNILRSMGQDGLLHSWPALFYRARTWPDVNDELLANFDLIDGYLMPKW